LHLALLALGIGAGDEVITSDFTFPATTNVIEILGARPVLVDIDPGTYNLESRQVEAAVTPRTKAVLVVHEFGLMADMAPLQHLAARGVAIVEDAACALGAEQRLFDTVTSAGAAGVAGCFSFHPRKSITTGEGGCITVADPEIARRLLRLRNHGLEAAGASLDVIEPGLNYRLTEVQAAIGIAQLQRLADLLAERRRIASRYDERLRDCDWLQRPIEPTGRLHSWQSYVVLLPADINRESAIEQLRAAGVETVRGAYAVHRLRHYRERYGYQPGAFPRSSDAHDRALALPLYPGLTEAEIDHIVSALKRIGDNRPSTAD
jgi:dTDP-4-amino-4,6-dideoxygalactose transaminase